VLLLLSFGCTVGGGGADENKVASPTFNPAPGTYTAALDVSITTPTPDATIHYTTDGSIPTPANGTVYAAPVHVADTLTLKAVASRTDWTTSAVTSGQYEISTVVAAPVFSPGPGTYASARDVLIVTTTAGATIRYTTDGSVPTEATGTVYSGAVHIAASLTLKAVAYRAGLTTSAVTTGDYTIAPQVAAPVFNPAAGAFADPQDVAISTATPGSTIRYTTDGSTPTATAGTVYAGPVHITGSLTLKAVAYQAGWTTSPVTSGEYTIGFVVAAPVFTPGPGAYAVAQDVAVTTATAGAAIRYTTDGSTPTETAGIIYTGPVRIAASLTLKAVAYQTGWMTSAVTSGGYTIGQTVAAPVFSVPPGTYASAQDVTIATMTTGASIRYTTDGSTPTETAGTLYTGPVRIAGSLTLKAVAYRTGWTTSTVTSGEYRRVGIAAGFLHTVLARSDGAVWAWGGNFEGQIGDGTTTPRATPAQIAGISGVAAVAAGYHHTIAVKSDGTVWGWGRNMFGQLGDNTTTQRLSPVQVQGITGITAVAAGENSSYALKGDGTVWAWGRNNEGQLGDGTRTDRPLPVQVQGLSGVTALAAGALHAVALKDDGTVWAWGNNLYGELGDGTTTSRLLPGQVPGLDVMTAIAANGFHTAAVRSDGTLWSWGSGSYGELGYGDRPMSRLTPVQAVGLTAVAAVDAGSYHTVASLDDRTLWACGHNNFGQLGDGTNTDRAIAVPVVGIADVIAVGASQHHTVAITSDGAVWAWGHNLNYQLGDGTTTDRWTPVKILQ